MQDFRNLEVWQVAQRLALQVYRVPADFPSAERYGLTAQMRRAAVSVTSNIVEGTARGSDRETARFLRMALASAAELHSQLILVQDLGILDADRCHALEAHIVRVKRCSVASSGT